MAYGLHAETGILNNVTANGDITASKVRVNPPRKIKFSFNNLQFGQYTYNWTSETLWDLNSDLELNIQQNCSNQCSGSCSANCKNSCSNSCTGSCGGRCSDSCSGCSGESCGRNC